MNQKDFAAGYQAALADIQSKLDEDGLNGVRTWLRDNLQGYPATASHAEDLVAEHDRGEHYGDVLGCPTCIDLAERSRVLNTVPGDPGSSFMLDVVARRPR